MINNCKGINDAEKFLRDQCNIIFDNADTGAITGWNAGTSTVKANESIVDERGVQQDIINGLYTWWIKEALDLIETSYGVAYRFNAPNASVREMNAEFVNDDISAIAYVSHRYNVANGQASALILRVNMKYYS